MVLLLFSFFFTFLIAYFYAWIEEQNQSKYKNICVVPLGLKDFSLAIYRDTDLSVVIQTTECVEQLLHDGAFYFASGLSSSELFTETQTASCHGASRPFHNAALDRFKTDVKF